MSNIEGHIHLILNEPSQLDDRLPLFRRGVFDADLARLSQEALESASSLLTIMFDLDHFKTINDTHGHPIGDEVLLGAAKVVNDRVKVRVWVRATSDKT